MILIFDAEGALEFLPLELFHHSFCIGNARAPGNIMGFSSFSERSLKCRVMILAVQLLQAIQRIETRSEPNVPCRRKRQ